MRLFDYNCTSCDKTEEILLTNDELMQPVKCGKCHSIMNRILPAPRGYVLGSRTPVNQFKRN